MTKVSVLVVDQQLDPVGIIANTSFVLGLTAGRELPENTFGEDVVDGEGKKHSYLTNIGHFVRKASQGKMKSIRSALSENKDTLIVDYTNDAAPSDYNEYATNLSRHAGDEIVYRAVYFYGPEEVVVPLTKNLSRL